MSNTKAVQLTNTKPFSSNPNRFLFTEHVRISCKFSAKHRDDYTYLGNKSQLYRTKTWTGAGGRKQNAGWRGQEVGGKRKDGSTRRRIRMKSRGGEEGHGRIEEGEGIREEAGGRREAR